jgi:hypothetical protein
MNPFKYIYIACLLVLPFALFAQGPPDGGGGGEDPDAGIPIDGGIGLLLGAGALYGIKKVKDQNKEKEQKA